MTIIHLSQVDIAQDIHIVHQERLVALQERPCLQDAATCIEQLITLVADVDIQTKVIVLLQEVNDLLTKMMNIDGYIRKASLLQSQ